MKRIFLFAIICMGPVLLAAQPGDRYTAAMKKNLAAFDTAFRNPANLLAMANQFERIAQAEKNQWLPYYYASLCQVNYAFMEEDKTKTDPVADVAERLALKADSLMPGQSEISCLRSMIASARLMVNPMQRYMQYGPEADKYLELAKVQDPGNPRPHYLKGQSLKYTPEQFGGGCKTARPELETALAKYGQFKPASELHPGWGKEQVERLLQECP